MKRSYYVMSVLLITCFLLTACNNRGDQVTGGAKQEQKHDLEKNNELDVQKGTPEWTMLQIEKAVEDNDVDGFMSYQNKDNPTFYKEQLRWIEEAIFKKDQGYKVSVEVSNFTKVNDTEGIVYFKVMMSHPNAQTTNNIVNYQIIMSGDKWVLNDVPFENISSESGTIIVYYKNGQEEPAKKTLKDATDIVNYYVKLFNWTPGPISIKIYPTNQEVSATVPWIMLGGWNEIGESLKITTDATSRIFKYLAHELTHKMVGDLTNDNASIYIQEGFATYLGVTITRDRDGNVSYDHQKAIENSKKAIEISNTVKTIEELGKIDYTDPNGSMYRDGALLSTYLIESKGLNSFLDMLTYLANFEYIDKRVEHKLEILHLRTVEAIENEYGPSEEVSADVKKYHLN